MELAEDGALATRQSGVNQGICFLGPLPADRTGLTYFEVEVTELEANRSQTMALGFCCNIPDKKPLLTERAKDLGVGSMILGYDLPKLFVHGKDVEKVPCKEWRPLKEIKVGTIIGVLLDRSKWKLNIYADGVLKVSMAIPGSAAGDKKGQGAHWPAELFGVIDVHGTVRSARVGRPGTRIDRVFHPPVQAVELAPTPVRQVAEKKQAGHESSDASLGSTATTPLEAQVPPSGAGCASLPDRSLTRLPSTQEVGELASQMSNAVTPTQATEADLGQGASAIGARGKRRAQNDLQQEAGRPAQRLRLPTFQPCGCTVHLLCHSGNGTNVRDTVHILTSEYTIGRNPRVANLILENKHVPYMVSRRHAEIISTDDGVEVRDCDSVNGTWLNEEHVSQQKLRHGDTLVIGNLDQVTSLKHHVWSNSHAPTFRSVDPC